ncbi:MAG: hypothetical protein DRI84_06485 [Bacteroidetes bacterium]|nr:MAG: hypothetical protein DRI84_06485 [Bacteroidota bacterium]
MLLFKKYTVILFIICFANTLVAQSTFVRTYGHSGYFKGVDLVQNPSDSSYFLVGNHTGFSGSQSIYLLKTDSLGVPIWDKSIGDTRNYQATDIFISNDNYLYICGSVDNFNTTYDILLIKADINGNIVWEKNYGGNDWDLGVGIDTINSDSIVVGATTYSYGSGSGDYMRLLVNQNGDSLQQITYGSILDEQLNDIRRTSIGFLYSGKCDNGTNDIDACVLYTDFVGDTIFSLLYGDTAIDIAYAGFEIDAGEVFIAGVTRNTVGSDNEDNLLLRLDATGTIMNTPSIFSSAEDNGIYGGFHLKSSYNIFSGYDDNFGGGKSDAKIFHFNNNGIFLGGSTIGSLENEFAYNSIATIDTCIAAIGTTWSWGDALSNILFIKTLDNGAYNATNYQHYTSIPSNDAKHNTNIIFPNPVKCGQEVYCKEEFERCEIYNQTGQIVKVFYTNSTLNTSGLTPAIYYLKFYNSERISLQKLIIL